MVLATMLANLIRDGILRCYPRKSDTRIPSKGGHICSKFVFSVTLPEFGISFSYRFRAWSLRTLHKKARIHVPGGAFLLGVVGN